MKFSAKSLLVVCAITFASIVSGCAAEAEQPALQQDEAAQDESVEGSDALSSAARTATLNYLRARYTVAPDALFRGAAFLRRGDKLVFRVNRYSDNAKATYIEWTVMGRKVVAGRTVDYALTLRDLAGSNVEFPEGSVTQFEYQSGRGVFVRAGGGVKQAGNAVEYSGFSDMKSEIYCEAIARGFRNADFGFNTSGYTCG